MKTLKRMLFTILCLPLLPIIGIPDDGGAGSSAAAGAGGASKSGDDAGGANTDTGAKTGVDGKTGSADSGAGQGDKAPRTFTQEEVTAMMTREKSQGRAAALAELGITDPAQAKILLEMASKLVDAGKTPGDKLSEEAQKAAQAEARAQAAEAKLTLVTEKVKTEFLDDVYALATARTNDKTDFKAALAEVKKAHPAFFDGEAGDGKSGTGNPPNNKKGARDLTNSYGKRAAAIHTATATQKSSFFKNS